VERNRISSLQIHGKAFEKECCLLGVFCDSGDTPANLLCELIGHQHAPMLAGDIIIIIIHLLITINLNLSQGLPGDGQFRRPEDVGVVCTNLIFTCSVMHSAVNYPQYNEYGFPPNYPLSLNGMPPADKV